MGERLRRPLNGKPTDAPPETYITSTEVSNALDSIKRYCDSFGVETKDWYVWRDEARKTYHLIAKVPGDAAVTSRHLGRTGREAVDSLRLLKVGVRMMGYHLNPERIAETFRAGVIAFAAMQGHAGKCEQCLNHSLGRASTWCAQYQKMIKTASDALALTSR